MRTVLVNGSWDPFHIGHLNLIKSAAGLGDRLVVAVATDEYIREYRGRDPFSPYSDRARIMSELRSVDVVIPYYGSEDMKPVDLYNVNIAVRDQFYGVGEGPLAERQKKSLALLRKRDVTVVIVPRTLNISSTLVRSYLND